MTAEEKRVYELTLANSMRKVADKLDREILGLKDPGPFWKRLHNSEKR
jgi:hypothetical protein